MQRNLTFYLSLGLALAAAGIPPADATNHCGSGMAPVYHYPAAGTYTRAVKTEALATFSDTPAHCGVSDWYWSFGNHVWPKLGSATTEEGHYVLRAAIVLDQERTYNVNAHVEEHCCMWNGQVAYADQPFSITIHYCNEDYGAVMTPTGHVGTDKPTITVTFQRTDDLCPIESGQLVVDGVVRDTTLSQNGPLYELSWTSPTSMIPGEHSVQASVTQQCCENVANTAKVSTFTGGFHVLGCGDNAHAVDYRRPQGTAPDGRPTISVAFRDVDRVCDVVDWGMEVDGLEVRPTFQGLGGVVVLSHQPQLPLLPGPHTVRAFVRERCCMSTGTSGGGETVWTFTTTAATDTGFGYNASVPSIGSSTTLGGPTPIPGVSHPLVPVGVDPFTLPLPGPLVVEAETEETPLGVYVDPAHTADETRIPIPNVTTITLCPKGSTPCPAPVFLPGSTSLTVTLRVSLAGQTLYHDTRTIPLIP